jgi:hypothetical protein
LRLKKGICRLPTPGKKDVPNPASDLPPKLPNTSEALQRAILLLGNRTKTELTDKSRYELVELLGSYPSAEQAAVIRWSETLAQKG